MKSSEVNTDRFYHKLQFEQLGKFVDVGVYMEDNIKRMADSIEGMNKVVGGLDNKYHIFKPMLPDTNSE